MTPTRVARRLVGELRCIGIAAWRGLLGLLTGNDLTHAAAIAYYALLSFFPFLLLVISILGWAAADEAERVAVLSFVFRYFPTQFDFVTAQLDAFRQMRVPVGLAGGLMLIWAALGVFGAVTAAVNEAWRVEKPRSFLKHRLVSFLMLVAAGGGVLLGLILLSIAEVAQTSWFGAMLARFQWLRVIELLVLRYSATLLLILAVSLVFYFIPNVRTRYRDVWVGAILTGVLWRLALDGFSWYIANTTRLTFIHGSIAAVVVFLLWVYVSAVILIYGAEFTAVHARLRGHRPMGAPVA